MHRLNAGDNLRDSAANHPARPAATFARRTVNGRASRVQVVGKPFDRNFFANKRLYQTLSRLRQRQGPAKMARRRAG